MLAEEYIDAASHKIRRAKIYSISLGAAQCLSEALDYLAAAKREIDGKTQTENYSAAETSKRQRDSSRDLVHSE